MDAKLHRSTMDGDLGFKNHECLFADATSAIQTEASATLRKAVLAATRFPND